MTNNENVFLFLGKTGVGKSLAIKLLSKNLNVVVSNSKKSCTKSVNGYNCSISSWFFLGLNYKLIDTPGLNDSEGEDASIVSKIKTYLTDKTLKVKGIFIFLNFQDVRFGNAEKNIIKQIYKLIPIDNFWEYVTIVFTHYYGSKRKSAEKQKSETEQSLQSVFEELIFEAFKKELIIPIKAKDLRIKYIDVYDPNDPSELNPKEIIKINKPFLDEFKKIFKELSKKEPLYSEILESTEKQKVVEKVGDNFAYLYDCQVKTYKYLNQKGDVIKQKSIILDKTKIKTLEYSDFGFSLKAYLTSIGAGIAAVGCYIGAAVFPPAAPGLVTLGTALTVGEYGAMAVGGVKYLIDKNTNETFDNTKTLDDFDD